LRLLYVTLGVPHPGNGGAAQRDAYLIRQLAARGHDVRALCLVDVAADLDTVTIARAFLGDVQLDVVPAARPAVRAIRALLGSRRDPLVVRSYHEPRLAELVARTVAEWRPDVLQIEHSLLAGYERRLAERSRPRAVLSLHNLSSGQYRQIAELPGSTAERAIRRVKARLMEGWEPAIAARFDRCIVVSEQDRRRLLAVRPGLLVEVVENGVDAEALVPVARPAVGRDLIFVGTMGYPPNADAAVRFARAILPRVRAHVPEARLLVVGRNPPPAVRALAADAGIVVTGGVADVVEWYRRASVAAVPVRAGGGTRIKVLEALALGVPVVTTRLGCEGLGVEAGRHVLVADSDEAFADRVAELLSSPELGVRLAQAGRRLVEERYDWRAVAARLEHVYRDVQDSFARRRSGS
jgi:glycosyltransferase involved in cell wall biosynthesis